MAIACVNLSTDSAASRPVTAANALAPLTILSNCCGSRPARAALVADPSNVSSSIAPPAASRILTNARDALSPCFACAYANRLNATSESTN